MKIQIKCTGTEFLPLESIKDFQGALKRRSDIHFGQIKTSIEKYGFSFPFFIWKQGKTNWCLDGHGRLGALLLMQAEGWEIPELPVVFVTAKDKNEAKQKLLRMNSNFGEFATDGLQEFIDGMEIDWSELSIPGVGNLDYIQDIDIDHLIQDDGEVDRDPVEKVCPHCGGVL